MEPLPYKPRPAWMVPPQYNDAPEIPAVPADDDDPIDYTRGPHHEPLGDDDDEPEPGPEEGIDS